MTPLALALLLAAGSRPLPPWPSASKTSEPTEMPRAPRNASVRYATADRAFFDRGATDGLSLGSTVQIARGGRVVQSCAVDQLADAWSSCRVTNVRVGDALRFTPGPMPKPPKVPPPVQRASVAEVKENRTQLAEAPFVPVVFGGAEEKSRPLRASASLQHETWVMISRPDTGFDAESVHIQVAGTELGAGLRLFVDADAYVWSRRPDDFRAPNRDRAQLYVSDLEVAQRELGRSWVLAAGRVWAYRAASLGVFDGAQVGWRSLDGELEAGAFGGVIPDPVTMAPSGSNPLVGAYAAFVHGNKEGTLRWVDLEAHAAALPHEGAQTELQIDTLARLWVASVDLSGDVQMAPVGAPHLLEGARLDASGNLTRTVHLLLSGRFAQLPSDVLTLPGEEGAGAHSRRGEVLLGWDALQGLTLSIDFGHVRDLDSGEWHGYLGPQVGLPRLFRGKGGLLFAYLEERGTSPGRSAWMQATWSPAQRLYLVGRASWFEDHANTSGVSNTIDELGLYAHADWHFTRAFWLRLSALSRLDLTTAADTGSVPAGLDVTLALGGDF